MIDRRALPLDAALWLTLTASLSAPARGYFLDLCCWAWANPDHTLPRSEPALMQIARCTKAQTWRPIWKELEPLLAGRGGGFVVPWIEKLRRDTAPADPVKVAAGRAGAVARWGRPADSIPDSRPVADRRHVDVADDGSLDQTPMAREISTAPVDDPTDPPDPEQFAPEAVENAVENRPDSSPVYKEVRTAVPPTQKYQRDPSLSTPFRSPLPVQTRQPEQPRIDIATEAARICFEILQRNGGEMRVDAYKRTTFDAVAAQTSEQGPYFTDVLPFAVSPASWRGWSPWLTYDDKKGILALKRRDGPRLTD